MKDSQLSVPTGICHNVRYGAFAMRIGAAVNTFSWNDMDSTACEYILIKLSLGV